MNMEKGSLPKIVEVNAYSGYKANERPRHFYIDGSRYTVRKILNRWVEPTRDCFEVTADDGKVYVLCWDRFKDLWYLVTVKDQP